jgi:hypothetical protein
VCRPRLEERCPGNPYVAGRSPGGVDQRGAEAQRRHGHRGERESTVAEGRQTEGTGLDEYARGNQPAHRRGGRRFAELTGVISTGENLLGVAERGAERASLRPLSRLRVPE